MLEYDWLITTLIYGLIAFFRSKLSDLTCPITNICDDFSLKNWTPLGPIANTYRAQAPPKILKMSKKCMPLVSIWWTWLWNTFERKREVLQKWKKKLLNSIISKKNWTGWWIQLGWIIPFHIPVKSRSHRHFFEAFHQLVKSGSKAWDWMPAIHHHLIPKKENNWAF